MSIWLPGFQEGHTRAGYFAGLFPVRFLQISKDFVRRLSKAHLERRLPALYET